MKTWNEVVQKIPHKSVKWTNQEKEFQTLEVNIVSCESIVDKQCTNADKKNKLQDCLAKEFKVPGVWAKQTFGRIL